jgi:uncharacterized protein (TIGR03118 family)
MFKSKRTNSMQRRTIVLAGGAVFATAACGGGSDSPALVAPPAPQNQYSVANLAASNASYKAAITLPEMIGAWGVAIRPAGAGGHFWVGAANASWEFIGDVRKNEDPALRVIGQDNLKKVTVPGTGGEQDPTPGAVTGVVYNGGSIDSDNFLPTGQVMPVKLGESPTTAISGSARFMFVTDSGYIGAWGERRTDNKTILRNDGAAAQVYPPVGDKPTGAYFGVAMKTDTWDKMWVADFGADPKILQFNGAWELEPTSGFINPFATGATIGAGIAKRPKPGDPVPFNITTLGSRVFVAYAISLPDKEDATKFFAGEEDALDAAAELATENKPNKGKLVEYTMGGVLVRIYQDDMRLNAPWGVEIAPKSFGAFSGAVLVSNFGGAGRVSAFSSTSGEFLGFLNNADGKPVAIEGLWGLQFGNGVSLGDSDALYFGAGPEGDNPSGVFGSIRYTPT